MDNKIITVTSPLLPDLDEFNGMLQDIWNRKWITNMGHYHQELEKELAKYLGVEYISLFTNGTLPLITALQALGITKGEVITTPYSFVATSHAIWWNGLKPVFVDVDPNTGNIDPSKIEAAITPDTVAILPVHVYGCPCDVEAIDAIARKHNLKVIYDAAHAFGVTIEKDSAMGSDTSKCASEGGKHVVSDPTCAPSRTSILSFGDISTLSFHATKVFNTIEGGALVCHSKEMKEKIDHLKNFGFEDEVTVVAPGINSKMDEMRSAYGLLNLKQVDSAIAARKEVAKKYVAALKNVPGIKLFDYEIEQVSQLSLGLSLSFNWNFAYFPILVTDDYSLPFMGSVVPVKRGKPTHGKGISSQERGQSSRDALYERMKAQGVLARRYFYPLISTFDPYNKYSSANKENLPVATKMADQVLCLPMHHVLSDEDVQRVLDCIVK